MDWRMRLFSYLFAAFCGVLISQFWFAGKSAPSVDPEPAAGIPAEVLELRARLQSEQSLRRLLESRIARLQAADQDETPAPVSPVVEIVPATAPPALPEPIDFDASSEDDASPIRPFEEVLGDAQFQAIFQAIADRVSAGDIDGAIEDLQKLEAALAAPAGEGPLAGLEPFYDGVMSYWVPQVLASCRGEGGEWLNLFIRAREMDWQGIEGGPLLNLFGVDEFLTLAAFSIPEISGDTGQLLLDHMAESHEQKGWLSDQELAALSRLPGEAVVRFLEQIWDGSTQNRDAVLAALTQVPHPSAATLLHRILPEIDDLKVRSALEIWLNR